MRVSSREGKFRGPYRDTQDRVLFLELVLVFFTLFFFFLGMSQLILELENWTAARDKARELRKKWTERGRQSSLERHTMTEADAFGNHWGHGFDLVIFACKFLSCGATNKT